jgi:adenylate kinase family enzyme
MNSLIKLASIITSLVLLSISNPVFSATPKHIILFGAPGAGTNAQVKALSEKYNLTYININLLVEKRLRDLYASITPSITGVSIHELDTKTVNKAITQANQKRADKIEYALSQLKKGQFIDDAIIDVFIAQVILQQTNDNGFIINGYPMNKRQASFLDALFDTLEDVHYSQVKVIYLNITDEVALKRMKKRKRLDDQLGFAKVRLNYFRKNMSSILEYYNDDVIEIDGTLPAGQITKDIERQLHLEQ